MKQLTLKQKYIEALAMVGYTEVEGKSVDQLSAELDRINEERKKFAEEARKRALIELSNGVARIVEVTASYTRKENLGNYESQDFFCSMKAEVSGTVDLQAIYSELQFKCQEAVRNQIDKLKEKKENTKKALGF